MEEPKILIVDMKWSLISVVRKVLNQYADQGYRLVAVVYEEGLYFMQLDKAAE